MKPHLSPCRDGYKPGKWQCISYRKTAWGNTVCIRGTGYSVEEAYRKWKRHGANPLSPYYRSPR